MKDAESTLAKLHQRREAAQAEMTSLPRLLMEDEQAREGDNAAAMVARQEESLVRRRVSDAR